MAASLMLEGQPRSDLSNHRELSGIRAPVPPHAAPIFAKLFTARGYASLEELQTKLRETHAHTPEITPTIRTAHLGIQAPLLSLGLFLMFAVAAAVSVMMVVAAESHTREAEAALADLRDPSKHEELKRMQGAAPAINNPRALDRIEAFRIRKKAEGENRRAALASPQRFLMEPFDRAMEAARRDRMLQAEHDLFVWAAANEKTPAGKGDSPWSYRMGPAWGVLAAVPLIWILAAALLRGGLSMMITGIAVVRNDGRRAFRRQCAFRAAVVWVPFTSLLLGSVWVQIYQYQLTNVANGLLIAAMSLLPVYAIVALRYPSRPPQDRLAGTHLVPA